MKSHFIGSPLLALVATMPTDEASPPTPPPPLDYPPGPAERRAAHQQRQARNPEREGERELRAPDPVTGLNLAGGRGEMSARQWRRYCKKFRQPFHGHGSDR